MQFLKNFNIFQCIILKPVQTKGFQIIGVDFTSINIEIIANSPKYFVRVSSLQMFLFLIILISIYILHNNKWRKSNNECQDTKPSVS